MISLNQVGHAIINFTTTKILENIGVEIIQNAGVEVVDTKESRTVTAISAKP